MDAPCCLTGPLQCRFLVAELRTDPVGCIFFGAKYTPRRVNNNGQVLAMEVEGDAISACTAPATQRNVLASFSAFICIQQVAARVLKRLSSSSSSTLLYLTTIEIVIVSAMQVHGSDRIDALGP